MTPDVIYDQLIGMGCARKLVFSWGGNPGVGSLHRFRDAVEHGWPPRSSSRSTRMPGWRRRTRPGRRTCRSACCAATPAPTSPARTRVALDRRARSPASSSPRCPRSGPTSGSSTPSRPTAQGNVQLWGIAGVQKEVVLASRALDRHRRGDRRRARAAAGRRRPAGLGDRRRRAACRAARTRPTRTATTSATTTFYVAWDAISRDREAFTAWMREHVLEAVAGVTGRRRTVATRPTR